MTPGSDHDDGDTSPEEVRRSLAAQLIQRATESPVLANQVRLAQKGVLVFGYDADADEFTFALSEMATEIAEDDGFGSLAQFVKATEPVQATDVDELADQLRPSMISGGDNGGGRRA